MDNKEQIFAVIDATEQALIGNFDSTDDLLEFFEECGVPLHVVPFQKMKVKVKDGDIDAEDVKLSYTVKEYMAEFERIYEQEDEVNEDPLSFGLNKYIQNMYKLYKGLIDKGLMNPIDE